MGMGVLKNAKLKLGGLVLAPQVYVKLFASMVVFWAQKNAMMDLMINLAVIQIVQEPLKDLIAIKLSFIWDFKDQYAKRFVVIT